MPIRKTLFHRLQEDGDPHSKFKNRYRFSGKTLGYGCYGEVRVVVDRATGEEYACKVCPLLAGSVVAEDDSSPLDQVVHEIEMMKALRHDGLVKLHEAFEDHSAVYMVMEMLGGGTLKEHVDSASGGFSETRAQQIFKQIMQALAFMHARDIVHRDLKLENVLFLSAGDATSVKIIDFGLAASLAGGSLHETCGTPMFAAPELMDASPEAEYGTAVDCWAAGVVLHTMLVGSPPFEPTDPQALLDSILHSEVSFEGGPWDSVSLDAKHLLAGLLNKDKTTRATASDALEHPWLVDGPGEKTRGEPALVAKVRPSKVSGRGTGAAKKTGGAKLGHRRATVASEARKDATSASDGKPAGSPKFSRAKSFMPQRTADDKNTPSKSSVGKTASKK